jgi:hypothetical protein
MLSKQNPMQHMLIYRETTQDHYVRNDPKAAPGYRGAWSAYIGALSDTGVMPSANGLQLQHIATTVRVRDDQRLIQDDPSADTREHPGGYVHVDAPLIDDVLACLRGKAGETKCACGALERAIGLTVDPRVRTHVQCVAQTGRWIE